MAAHSLPWFSWTRYWIFICSHHFSLCSLAWHFGWQSAENMCLYSSKSIREMIHILEIHPGVHGGSRLILKLNLNLNNKRTPEQHTRLYCTVLYCIKRGFQQRCIKRRFGAIHLFYDLIIHDHLESRAMNITDDTHEAIYQSAGNRWTRLEQRCTV